MLPLQLLLSLLLLQLLQRRRLRPSQILLGARPLPLKLSPLREDLPPPPPLWFLLPREEPR